MAYSYVKYPGNGSTKSFSIPFGYLDRKHVSVKVNDVAATGVLFSSRGAIYFATAPADGSVVEIRRYTPITTPMVVFDDTSTLTERDLNTLAVQNLYLAQENNDLAEELADELDNELDADVTLLRSSIKSVLTRASTALAQSVSAMNTANAASSQADATADLVTATGGVIQTNADLVSTKTAQTVSSALAASISASSASSSASLATTKATDAASSATDAAASAAVAALAANFNPNDFYTKVQLDSNRTTWAFTPSQITGLPAALAGKANTSHTHATTDITGLAAILAAKLDDTSAAVSAAKLTTTRTVSLTGGVTATGTFDGSANLALAATVVKLGTARAITLSGGVTGSVNFDGSAAVTIPATVVKLGTARAISLSGDVTGTVNFDGSAAVAIPANVIRLGTARAISLAGDVTGSANFDGSAPAVITASLKAGAHLSPGIYTPLSGLTNITFGSLPSTATRITLIGTSVRFSVAAGLLIQLGTSGGIVSTGYGGSLSTVDGAGSSGSQFSASGFQPFWTAWAPSAATNYSFTATLIRLGTSTNWSFGATGSSSAGMTTTAQGDLSLGGALTSIRIIRSGSTASFNAGYIHYILE